MSNVTRFRVISHPLVCPDCGAGADDITTHAVDTGDGLTEDAHTCAACGCAWPVACICDWDTPAPVSPEPGNLLKGRNQP